MIKTKCFPAALSFLELLICLYLRGTRGGGGVVEVIPFDGLHGPYGIR